MKKKIIIPRVISGFPELMPSEQILFNKIVSSIRTLFESFGFTPIETPVIERKEIVAAKSGLDDQIYGLTRINQENNFKAQEFAMRFDLTLPLARFVAQHFNKLQFPFRRYQIQKVWRGGRPQAGRYREFYQCDIDIIGDGDLSLRHDAEIVHVVDKIFSHLKFGDFIVKISNAKIMRGLLFAFSVKEEDIFSVIRALGRLQKYGNNHVVAELKNIAGINKENAKKIISIITGDYFNDESLEKLKKETESKLLSEGLEELQVLIKYIKDFGVPESSFQIDLSVARGLSYYTGTVYETFLVRNPGMGSICSGGRYDNLAENFIDKKLSGVGISIGLTRLFNMLLKTGLIKTTSNTCADVLVMMIDDGLMKEYVKLVERLRNLGINTEQYLEKQAVGKQLRYANQKGYKIVVIIDKLMFEKDQVLLKNLLTGNEKRIPLKDIEASVREML